MEEEFDDTTMDACLIAAGQRAEHYEMAAYGTLVAWAQAMGHTDAAKLLQQTPMKRRRPTKSFLAWPRAASTRVPPTRHILMTMRSHRRSGGRARPR
jgi:hypothetical protein